MNDEAGSKTGRLKVHAGESPVRLEVYDPSIDYSTVSEMGKAFRQAEFADQDILVDLSHVKYVDRFGFEMLVEFARQREFMTMFVGLGHPVRSLFQLAHLDFLVK